MNSPQDPRKEAFQDDEAALAKVLRALPGGEPSSRTDAAILAAARDATSGSSTRQRQHRRRGLPGWALGTAAAAVLAVGIGLQLQPGRDAMPEGLPEHAPAQALSNDDTLDQIEVSGSRIERTQPEAFGEPEAAAAQAMPASPSPAFQAPPAAKAPPAPAPRRAADEGVREEGASTTQSRAQSLESADSGARMRAADRERQARLAPEPVMESAPISDAAGDAGALPSAFSADDVLPPVEDDARLEPEAWLERIRERIRQGDRAGAQASLRRFERAHPDVALPSDLAAFRP